jgi:hypothetical protein
VAIGFHALAASAQPTAATTAESCWQRVSLPQTVLELSPKGKDPVTMTFRTAQGPVLVKDPLGGSIPDNPSFTGSLVLGENAGTLTVTKGDIRATTDQRGAFAVRQGDRTRFNAVAGTPVDFNTPVAIGDGKLARSDTGGDVSLAPGTVLEVILPADTHLQPALEAFEDDPNLPIKSETLDASPQPSVSPVNSLLVTVRGHGAQVYEDREILSACFLIDKKYYPAPIFGIVDRGESGVELVLKLPEELAGSGIADGKVALAAADGSYFATDSFSMRGRTYGISWGAAATLGTFFILGMVATPTARPLRTWSVYGWFTGPDGKASLSLFQILLWTVVVVFCLVYVFAITGKLFSITGQVLSLLGIAGTGSVVARIVASGQPVTAVAAAPSAADLFQTDGRFDLFKLQMFIFTVGAAAFVTFRVIADQAFPELDTNLLLLLGISNGIYVGSKFAATETPIQEASRLENDLKVYDLAKQRAEAEIARYKGEVVLIDQGIATLQAEQTNAATPAARQQAIPGEIAALQGRRKVAEQRQKSEEENLARIVDNITKTTAALDTALANVKK